MLPSRKKFVGIYQRLNTKDGYGPLEGMILPPVVNLTFICKYIDGNEMYQMKVLK